MRIRHINLTQGPVWKQILLFALPLLVTNLMQQAFSMADLMIVGNFSGVDAMAGVGATTSLINMLIGLALGLATGVSVVTVQVNSSEDLDGLYKVVHTGYALAFAAGLIMTALGAGLAPFLLKLMNTPPDILPYASTYLRIYFLASLPVLAYNIGAGILRGVGDTRHPFIFLSLGVILNILLDFLFVGYLGWGVSGAAWAYVIAQFATAALVTWSLMSSMTPFRLFLRDISFHPVILFRSLKVGVPAGLQAFIVSLSGVFIQTFINGFGKHAVAGFSAAARSDNFVFVLVSGLALAVMTFTGANAGAGRYDRVRKGLWQGLLLTFILVNALSAFLIVLRHPIARAFNSDPAVVDYATGIMLILISLYWVFALTEVIGATLRGLGYSVFPMVVSLICMAGVRVLWMYTILPVWNQFNIIIFAYPAAWAVSLVTYSVYLKKKGGFLFSLDTGGQTSELESCSIGITSEEEADIGIDESGGSLHGQ